MMDRRGEGTSRLADSLPSLLWPEKYARRDGARKRLGDDVIADLDLAPIIQELSGRESARERGVTSILTELCSDPEVIAYRTEVIDNLLYDPALRQRLDSLAPALSSLVREPERPVFGIEWDVGQIVRRLGSLESYVAGVIGLAQALDESDLRSGALQALLAAVRTLIATPEFQRLKDQVPSLRACIEPVQSVTIGINLSDDLRPESATILSIDAERIQGKTGLLDRLFGRDTADHGISPLRGKPGNAARSLFPIMQVDATGHENLLVQDLRLLLEQVTTPVGRAIQEYVWVNTRSFANLESEISFMLNAVALIERLQARGLPMCRPDIAPSDSRVSHLDDAYDVSLALRMTESARAHGGRVQIPIVTNPITFDEDDGRVWILTGPNRGGKTTFARAVGLAHILFQVGLYVPARRARISPIDAVYTHFPVPETTTVGGGRLDDEASRLAEIFHKATPHSLILLNEVLSGTSTLEGLGLAHDAVRGLRLLGARAIYVTHLHELAQRTSEINAGTPGDGTVGSLVAEVEDTEGNGQSAHRRTFRIRPKPPNGSSYASEIARQHGISFQQLEHLLHAREVLTQTLSNSATPHTSTPHQGERGR